MSTDGEASSRFERVREILRDAAGGRAGAYAGSPIWEFSRDELLGATLEGVRLIATPAAETGSCCSHHGRSDDESRSARSGLVRGLRGERPFDGSQFPRLPWGAA